MEDRLDSWKAIANHLRRGVRTVQRWEQQEGLPVHRLEHDSKATVYAFKSELDAWWADGQLRPDEKNPKQRSKIGVRPLVAGAVVVFVVIALVAWLWPTSSHLNFEERDWVLVANFENLTGEAVFDGTLQHALERELANSRYANVVPRERVHDSLRLMKLPLDSPLDPALAREVALRDGEVRALATGRIEMLDTTYLLSLTLINPADGVTVASFSSEAVGHAEVVSIIRALSNKLRRSLGENLARIQETEQSLEKVTTPSLVALNYYTLGMRLVDEFRFQEAIEFLERAVQEDPEFASAHNLLAHCHSNWNREEAASLHYVKAFESAEMTMDHERYFIQGSYHGRYTKDSESAVLAYKALLEIQPDHFWGNRNLAHEYAVLGQPQRALQFVVAAARLRPNRFWIDYRVASMLLLWNADSDLVEEFEERMHTSMSTGDARQIWALGMFDVRRAWFTGDREASLSKLDRMVREIETLPEVKREDLSGLIQDAAAAYLAVGKLGRAEELLRYVKSDERLVYLGLATNRPRTVLDQVRHMDPHFWMVPFLVKVDQLELAEAMYAELVAPEYNPPGPFYPGLEYTKEAARGALAFGRGEMDEAIVHLTEALRLLPPYAWSLAQLFDSVELLAADLLAQAWETKGDLLKAAEALRHPVPETAPYPLEPEMSIAVTTELKLATVHRQLGNSAEADRIEAKLRAWLAFADPDHPVLAAISK